MIMNVDALINELKQDEGWRPSAYHDTEGFLTIGFGFMIDEAKSGQLPMPVAEFWLLHNIKSLTATLSVALPNWSKYPDQLQRALINMAYQMGISGLLGFKRMIANLDDGEWSRAAAEALDSKWHRQTPNRARRVAEMIRTA